MRSGKTIQRALEKAQQDFKQPSKAIAVKGVIRQKTLSLPTGRNEKWHAPKYEISRRFSLNKEELINNRCICFQNNAIELDYYKVLRTQLQQQMSANGWNTIMVSSIRPGEGKTVTSINLAGTFSMAYNQTVLLMDCDLRRQNVCRQLGISNDLSIVDYLVDGRSLSDLIIWPNIEKMTLISGHRTSLESTELLGSPQMKNLLHEIKHRYNDRCIIIDTPPLLSGADTLTLAPLVDGIVIVVESGGPSSMEIKEAMELIPKNKFMGFVLNKHNKTNMNYYPFSKHDA